MSDIIIIKGRGGRASVYGETEAGRRWIQRYTLIEDWLQPTINNEVVEDFVLEVYKTGEDLIVEVR